MSQVRIDGDRRGRPSNSDGLLAALILVGIICFSVADVIGAPLL